MTKTSLATLFALSLVAPAADGPTGRGPVREAVPVARPHLPSEARVSWPAWICFAVPPVAVEGGRGMATETRLG